jgi:hypothetical protein
MAKRKAADAEVIDVPATVSPDELDAQQAAGALGTFFKGLAQFFKTATALEVEAKSTLAVARSLTIPTNAAQHETLQRFIRDTSAQKKAIEQHWTITSSVSQFHRKLTAKRAIAANAVEEANTIGNRLHNAYVEAEKRRAREEEQRLQREAEEKARRERDAELAKLEAEALAREAASGELSTRELAFVLKVAEQGIHPQVAAQQAGYKDPAAMVARLMGLPKIDAAIKARREAAEIRRQAAAKQAAPLVYDEPEVRPDIADGGDRTTHAGECFDARLLVEAVIGGKHGIPADVLTVDPVRLNQYARDMHELINRWPGVRYKKTTKVL